MQVKYSVRTAARLKGEAHEAMSISWAVLEWYRDAVKAATGSAQAALGREAAEARLAMRFVQRVAMRRIRIANGQGPVPVKIKAVWVKQVKQ